MPKKARKLPRRSFQLIFFFFNDTATTEIYTLSLHDALPIYGSFSFNGSLTNDSMVDFLIGRPNSVNQANRSDRKSTRLNSSHVRISYAVFCLKKNTRYSV